MDAHGAAEDFFGLLIVRALFFLGEVIADDGRFFSDDPLRGFLGEIGRLIPPFGVGGVVSLRPVGSE